MSWLNDAKVTTAEDKLLEKVEENKRKAIAAQEKALEKAEKDDRKVKYGIGTPMSNEQKKALKDYIKNIQKDIDNPPSINYDPPAIP